MAADSLSQMIPGLLGGSQAQGMLNGQRERLMQQIGNDLNNTLLYVYRDLSDPRAGRIRNVCRVGSRQGVLQGGVGSSPRRLGGRSKHRQPGSLTPAGASLLAKNTNSPRLFRHPRHR